MPLICNRFKILNHLANGGMGEIYLAEDSYYFNSIVVLKQIRQTILDQSNHDALSDFKNEFEVMTKLKHPNLVKVYEFLKDDSSQDYYISMEYIKGITLRQFLQQNQTVSLDKSLKIITELLRTLEFVHSRNIVFRDLKPENIIIQTDENNDISNIKLLDFGLCDIGIAESKIKGTVKYMAPEVLTGNTDWRSDIFGLGVIFFELLSGDMIYQNVTQDSIINLLNNSCQFKTEVDLSFKKLNHPFAETVITRMVAYKKENRYQNCISVIKDINDKFHSKNLYETPLTQMAYITSPPFSGRIRQIKDLTSYLYSDQIKTVLIIGSRGVGKTRLISELKNIGQINDLVWFDISFQNNSQEKFKAIKEFGQYILSKASNMEIQTYASDLKTIFPTNPVFDQIKDYDAEYSNYSTIRSIIVNRFIDLTFSVINNIKEVIVISYDNLEYADEESRDFFIELAKSLKQKPEIKNIRQFGILDLENSDSLHSDLKTLKNLGYADLYMLKPFDFNEISEYLNNIFGAKKLSNQFKDNFSWLLNKAGGNPYYLQLLLEFLLNKNIIFRKQNSWDIKSDLNLIEIGDIYKEIAGERYQNLNLSDQELHFLKILALINQTPVPKEWLEYILKAIGINEFNIFFENLIDREIIISSDKSVILGNDLIRQKIFKDSNSIQVQAIHNELFKIFKSLFSNKNYNTSEKNKSFSIAIEIAFHFCEGSIDLDDEVIVFLTKTAHMAAKYYINDLAEKIYLKLNQSIPADFDLNKKGALLFDLSEVLLTQAKWNQALEFLNQACQIVTKTDDILKTGKCLLKIGFVYEMLFKYDESLTNYQNAYTCFKNSNQYKDLANCLICISALYRKKADFESLNSTLNEAIAISKEHDLSEEYALSNNYLGVSFVMQGKFDLAKPFFEKANSLVEKISNKLNQCKIYSSIGYYYFSQGSYEKALPYYHKDFELSKLIGDKHGLALTLNNIASLFNQLGDNEKSLSYIDQCTNQALELNDPELIASAYSTSYQIYFKTGDFNKAFEYSSRTIEIEKTIDNKRNLCDTLFFHSLICKYLKKPDLALLSLEEALELAKITDYELIKAKIYTCKGDIYNDQKNFDLAFKHYRKALQIVTSCKHFISASVYLGRISDIYKVQKDFNKALEYINKALTIDFKHNFTSHISNHHYSKILYLICNLEFKTAKIEIQKLTDFCRTNDDSDYLVMCRSLEILADFLISTDKELDTVQFFKDIDEIHTAVTDLELLAEIFSDLYFIFNCLGKPYHNFTKHTRQKIISIVSRAPDEGPDFKQYLERFEDFD